MAPVVRDVLLRNGTPLRLQSPQPEDFEAIKAFYAGLSPASRYLRFHGSVRPDIPARDYAQADGANRVVLIARQGGRVVAAGGFDRLREPGVAEVALAVADDWQRRGVAPRMLEQLALLAAERGIERFNAEVLMENRPMLAVFEHAGYALRRRREQGRVTASLDIRPSEVVEERIDELDHLGAVASLRPILQPRSIAVVADFGEPTGLGRAVLGNILDADFQGAVDAVSPAGGVVRSLRVAPSVAELAEAPELVVVAVSGEAVLDVASQAVERGAKALLVLAAGPDGRGRLHSDGHDGSPPDDRLLAIVRDGGLRMVGPNCLGILNSDPAVRLNATFAGARVPPGRLAVCSQSGALGIALLGRAATRRLGISSFASLGSGSDVSTNDLLELWEEDDRSSAVILYLETFGNPEHFVRIARRVARRKPILAVKGRRPEPHVVPGRSQTAGALRGDAVVDALLHQAGVLRIRSGEGLLNAAEFFASQPLPPGRRVAIVSNSAGALTLARDALGPRGLEIAEPGNPDGAPVQATDDGDLGIHAGPPEYRRAIAGLVADQAVDAIVAFYVDLSGGDPSGVLDAVSRAAAGSSKPVVASVVGADGAMPKRRPQHVPNFLFPESCAGVLAYGAQRREWLSRPLGLRVTPSGLDGEAARELVAARLAAQGEGWLSAAQGEALLATHRIPTVSSTPCLDPEAAVSAAEQIGKPVVLRAALSAPLDAAELGAVLTGLEGREALWGGWQELQRRVQAMGHDWHGVAVQPLVAPGADLLVGAIADPEIGPVMAMGLAGPHAGRSADVAFRLPPTTDVDAGELLDASPSVARQLDGIPGGSTLDREALRDLVLRFAALLDATPQLVEVDLCPVRCLPDGCVVLDARLRVARQEARPRVKTW